MWKDKTGNTTQIQRRCEDTAATAPAIRGTRGKDLEQNNQYEVYQQQIAVPVEEGIIHHRVPFGIAHPIQQQFYRIVTFAIQRWEKEYQDTQHGTAHYQFLIGSSQPSEHAFHRVHGPGKIKGNQSAEDTQHNDIRNTLQFESLVQMEFEHGIRTRHDIGNSCSRHRRYQQRQQGGHCQIYHQYLQRKYQTGNRRLENACNRTGSTTSHQ